MNENQATMQQAGPPVPLTLPTKPAPGLVALETPAREYKRQELWRSMCRCLVGGTESMREAGRVYLPQRPHESNDAYAVRLAQSTLVNYLGQAVDFLVGKVFSGPFGFADSHPDFQAWVKDIDLQGTSLHAFAQIVFREMATCGVGYVLADMAPVSPDAVTTVAEAKSQGMRPYLVHIPTANLIGWRVKHVNGMVQMVQVRIREEVLEPDGEFGEKWVSRIRVLEPGKFTVYEKQEEAADGSAIWAVHQRGVSALKYIPLVPIYAQHMSPFVARPPLMNLAYLNIRHWQSKSAQDHILDYTRFPLLFGRCLGKQDGGAEITVGANSMITSEDEHADLKHVEHTGAAMSAGRQDLQDLEQQMAFLSMEPMLQKQPKAMTATKTAIDTSAASAPVQSWAVALKQGLEKALGYMSEFANHPADTSGSIEIDFDFTMSLTSQDAPVLLQMQAAGLISRLTCLRELQRRGIVSADIDLDSELLAADDDAQKALLHMAALMSVQNGANATPTVKPDGQKGTGQMVGQPIHPQPLPGGGEE